MTQKQNRQGIDYNDVARNLKVTFQNIRLLEQAFTHRSFLNESKQQLQSNERLEFLGDSVLSLIVSSYLYKARPQDEEGDLTNLRAYLVKTKSLAEAAENLNLGQYLRLSKGEKLSGGRENIQLLANTFESVLGSIYLDQGFSEAEKFIYQNLLPLFEEEIKKGPPKDAKSALQEVAQNQSKQSPHYRVLATHGPDHAKQFTIGVFIRGLKVGEGEGNSKQEAEELAAAEALEKLVK